MDGFKNSTKTRYDTMSGKTFANGGMVVSRNDMAGGQGPMSKPAMVAKYAKGGAVKKIGKVMGEFKRGELHSGSKKGPEVTSKKQATAIALSEARKAGAKIPMKKGGGGSVEGDDVLMARMTKEELAQGARGVRMAQERLERKTVKRGVPPSSDKPLISPRMQEVGKSIGVTKKAAGGLTLSNVPQSARLTLSNVPKTAPAAAPKRGLTLASTTPPKRGLRLGMNKGGLSAMPKGKGC
jgi:hypothetical protein